MSSRVFQSWDIAAKEGTHTERLFRLHHVATARVSLFSLDMFRGRFDYPDLRNAAINLARRFKPAFILIEDSSNGTALDQEFRKEGIFSHRSFPSETTFAHVLVPKYADDLPSYRQAQIFTRQRSRLDRSWLADWVCRAAWHLRPVLENLLAYSRRD